MIVPLFRRGSAFASKKALKYLKTISPKDIKKVTVIRHAAIGDFMNIRPFLINLREFMPNAEITLSVENNAMYGMPEDLVDKIHIMHRHHPKDMSKKTGLFYRIKEAKQLPPQDIVFDLSDSALSFLLTFFSNSKLKIGYPYRQYRRWFYDIATLRSEFVIEAETVQHMLNFLGSKNLAPLNYGLDNKYPKDNIKKQIIYFAGASSEDKRWEKEKFQILIEKLSSTYRNYDHIILQGIQENEKFLDIFEQLKHNKNIKLQSTLDIDNVMLLISNSYCIVSNDTGLRNMALAVKTPTVGIFLGVPFRYWPRDGEHDCVFTIDHTSPNVDDVYNATINLINKLYVN
jgi:ADP-heptose:LPS heptosyltransferase